MKEAALISTAVIPLLLLMTGGFVLLMANSSPADPLEDLSALLPAGIGAWRAETPDRYYDDVTIFSYINGGAEVYLAYDMRRCLSRRYAAPQSPAIVLDIFDMGSSKDAFGIFTHDLDGETMAVGQGGRYRPGWLSFWKDRFFVSIYAEADNRATEKAVKDLGRIVGDLITAEGPEPSIIHSLPGKGLISRSIRYLHHYMVLNYHYYLADKNILHIGPQTDAVLAEYERNKAIAVVLLIAYPGSGQAEAALASFMEHYLPEAMRGTNTVLLENGKWSAAGRKGQVLCVVLEAGTREHAGDLIEQVLGGSE